MSGRIPSGSSLVPRPPAGTALNLSFRASISNPSAGNPPPSVRLSKIDGLGQQLGILSGIQPSGKRRPSGTGPSFRTLARPPKQILDLCNSRRPSQPRLLGGRGRTYLRNKHLRTHASTEILYPVDLALDITFLVGFGEREPRAAVAAENAVDPGSPAPITTCAQHPIQVNRYQYVLSDLGAQRRNKLRRHAVTSLS